MKVFIEPIGRLINEFTKLPGVGKKSAQRYAYKVINMTDEEAKTFAQCILDAKSKVHYCKICGNFSEGDVCDVCKNRPAETICVVKEPKDCAAIEKVFVNVNPQSTLLLGQARGAAISALVASGLTVHEFTALQIKQAVVGHGNFPVGIRCACRNRTSGTGRVCRISVFGMRLYEGYLVNIEHRESSVYRVGGIGFSEAHPVAYHQDYILDSCTVRKSVFRDVNRKRFAQFRVFCPESSEITCGLVEKFDLCHEVTLGFGGQPEFLRAGIREKFAASLDVFRADHVRSKVVEPVPGSSSGFIEPFPFQDDSAVKSHPIMPILLYCSSV